MMTQFYGIFVHILGNHIFVNVLDLGIMGTGLAGFVSNAFLLIVNMNFTARD